MTEIFKIATVGQLISAQLGGGGGVHYALSPRKGFAPLDEGCLYEVRN